MILVIDRVCALWSKQTDDALDHHSIASTTGLQVHRSDLARRGLLDTFPASRQNEVVERNNGEKRLTFEGQNAG